MTPNSTVAITQMILVVVTKTFFDMATPLVISVTSHQYSLGSLRLTTAAKTENSVPK